MDKSHFDRATMSGIYQLIAPDEIKREPDIKEEPMETGDLVEFPALINADIDQALDNNPSQYNDEGGAMNMPLGEAKSEVKREPSEKKKKKKYGAKANASKFGALDNRQGSHSLGHNGRDVKKFGKLSVPGNLSKQHKCNECGYMAKYKYLLELHQLRHTGKKPFPCNHCPKKFTHKRSLQNHMKVHVDKFLFNCATCFEGFDEKDEKLAHENECHIRRYECYLCKQSFGSKKTDLIAHIRVHSGTKPFKCTECSAQFRLKNNLKSHMKLHSGPCSFHCSRCRQGFVQHDEMVAHELKCSRRLYECYICGKFIGLDKQNLTHHMRTHTGDKPFQCNRCPTKFVRKGDLNRHMLIHSRSLPWKCAVCRRGFFQKTLCKERQHSCSRRVYECCFCRKFIGIHKSAMERHIIKHSGVKSFRCEICCRQFTQKSSLTSHINCIHRNKH